MPPRSFMLIAGEASGDRLAAGLVRALREECSRLREAPTADLQPLDKGFAPIFFGAGGEAMRAAGVEIIEDMTRHSVIGLTAVLRKLRDFAKLLERLENAAARRLPDVIICVDYGGFNLAFAAGLRRLIRRQGKFQNWRPRIVQFVSPQVWGSRPWRAKRMERDLDLLICLYPFEPEWFAKHTPQLPVVFVGHPLAVPARPPSSPAGKPGSPKLVLLLPGSRAGELRRHLPLMMEASRRIRAVVEARFVVVVPTEPLAETARQLCHGASIDVQCGGLEKVLPEATLAISKTGTVATQLAIHGLPAVTLYQTSWLTYVIARRLVTVKWLSMPNILAGEELFPEFVQGAATPMAVADAALGLLQDEARRRQLRERLLATVASLQRPAPFQAAARAILDRRG